MPELRAIVDPNDLEARLNDPQVRIVDLCPADVYAQGHIPGAVHLDYAEIVAQQPPVAGLLPPQAHLAAVWSRLGLGPEMSVVAYDNEGGGKAARLLWTLQVCGHRHLSLLNGGRVAWQQEGHPMETATPSPPQATDYPVAMDAAPIADRAYIQAHLDDPQVVLLDGRSPAEFAGEDVRARRGGHIPGAANLEWTSIMDRHHNLRLIPPTVLKLELQELGITPDKTVVTYCQTHHRSALLYWALRHLGYPHLKGYPGSWSDWGNQDDTPIA